MAIAIFIIKRVLLFIGVVLFACIASIHEINAAECELPPYSVEYASTDGFFYATGVNGDGRVYSDYVIYYPDSCELELDGKSIYSFNDFVVECELGEIVCDGESMYIVVELGDKTLSYPARFINKNGIAYYIFEKKDIRAIEDALSRRLGVKLY